MVCPVCGTQQPDSANFCMNCGTPLRRSAAPARRARWEYWDLTVPLNVDYRLEAGPSEADERCRQILRRRLERVRRDGWQAEGPTEWQSLLAAGYVRWGDFGTQPATRTRRYLSVTVRLKRLVQPQPADADGNSAGSAVGDRAPA